MPGSIQSATPSTVLPQTLCRAFSQVREFSVELDKYRTAEFQRSAAATNRRKRWRLAKRLTERACPESWI